MIEKLCLIGTNKIIQSAFEFKGVDVYSYGRSSLPPLDFLSDQLAQQAKALLSDYCGKFFVISSGLLQSKPIIDQSNSEIARSFLVNSAGPVILSEIILDSIEDAQIVLIGSESGKKGSFDLSYALSKSSLRMYVHNRCVKPLQQIVLISPSTIGDLGMTTRRDDKSRLEYYRTQHPKQRFLSTNELCDIILSVLGSSCYLTNTEIEVNGGKFALMKY